MNEKQYGCTVNIKQTTVIRLHLCHMNNTRHRPSCDQFQGLSHRIQNSLYFPPQKKGLKSPQHLMTFAFSTPELLFVLAVAKSSTSGIFGHFLCGVLITATSDAVFSSWIWPRELCDELNIFTRIYASSPAGCFGFANIATSSELSYVSGLLT
jgi:hypothetical protein